MKTDNQRFREPFTAENTVLLLVDHQTGLFDIVGDQPKEQLRNSVVSVAKAALVLDVPIILTSAIPDIMGPTIPELTEALSDLENFERTIISAWQDDRIRRAVDESGRSKLVFGAIGTNVCLVHAAIDAVADGYEAWGAIDLSGTSNEILRNASIEQMKQAGVGITTGAGVIMRILGDNARPVAKDVYDAMKPLFASAA